MSLVTRKKLLQALLRAIELRADLVEIVHDAENSDEAVHAVMQLMDLDDTVHAQAVLNLQVADFTAERRRRLEAEVAEEELNPSEG